MSLKRRSLSRVVSYVGILCLLTASAAALPAQKTKTPPVTLSDLRSVLGAANDFVSGVSDFSQGNGEVIITYRYYDVDMENYETDFSNEIAPRIQVLYKKFKTLDRVHFQIIAISDSQPGIWKPFAEFVTDRKTIEELHWTGFVARYVMEQVIKNRK
jgi:hypothetical protein